MNRMAIYTYGGPTYNENYLPPFDWDTISGDFHLNYNQGIPKVWIFKPFFFEKEITK